MVLSMRDAASHCETRRDAKRLASFAAEWTPQGRPCNLRGLVDREVGRFTGVAIRNLASAWLSRS
jgi:hypothetical protein